MNILHYSLGFPPFRSGGLVDLVMDLTEYQSKHGNNVSIIWPGALSKKHDTNIIKRKKKHLFSYEIINPLPVPLLFGINEPPLFMEKCISNVYSNFFDKNNFDILHIHTFMGMHKEFLLEAKKHNVKIIYTTHDYYGLCLKTTMYYKSNNCCDHKKCSICNSNSLNIDKIRFMQTRKYRFIKKIASILGIKKNVFTNGSDISGCNQTVDSDEIVKLYSFYADMFTMIDYFHFNSYVARDIYEKILGNLNGEVLLLSKPNLVKKEHKCDDEPVIKIGYIAGKREDKGYYDLLNVINKLGNKFIINVYGFNDDDIKVKYNKKYTKNNYQKSLEKNDVIIVPSKWNETFGFSTIEALSLSIPVIVSDTVGSKVVVKEEYGWIYKDCNDLERIMTLIDKNLIREKSRNIYLNYELFDYNNFGNSIDKIYRK